MFTVTADPSAARSIIAKYDNPTEAADRFNLELNRMKSGMVTLWKNGKIIAREEK